MLTTESDPANQLQLTPAQPILTFENLIDLDTARRFTQAGLASLGEHRRVSILFADLSRYTELSKRLDRDDLFDIMRGLIKKLVDIVYQYEGIVDKLLGDGIMAIFGAPVAVENHAERAVRAAMNMQSQVQGISQGSDGGQDVDLKLHIGINEGVVILGAIGSDLRMDYTAIGETVNLANRLQEVAGEGEILVSDSIFHATKSLFQFTTASQIQIKGYQQPVLVYRLLSEKLQAGSSRGIEGLSAPMVGRQRELEQLTASAKQLITNYKSSFVLVSGEAGIGKSRLKAEFKQLVQDQPLRILEGQSLTYRRSVPYWIFKSLLRDILSLHAEATPHLVRETISKFTATLLGEHSQDTQEFLEYLLVQEEEDGENLTKFAFLEPEQIQQSIFQSVRDLILAEARHQPMVIILEDLHWADDTSLTLLKYLVDSIHQAPIMVCALSRPDIASQLVEMARSAELSHGLTSIHLSLENLSLLQSEQLFSELLKIPELPEYFRLLVLKRAEGIPFYLEEILRMLIDDGSIHFQDGHWRMALGVEVASLRVPGNLQNLILTRFDRLEPAHRQVLQAASVIGIEFYLSILVHVLPGYDESQVKDILACLVNRGFLISPSSAEFRYQFRHALTCDGVYSTLLKSEKVSLHGRVAEAIEQQHAGILDEQIEILAGHYKRSPNQDKALHYLLLAGQKAGRQFANQQSIQHYQEATDLLSRVHHSPDQARQIWTGLGDVHTFVGEYQTARQEYLEALSVCERIKQSENQFVVLRECSQLQWKIATTYERQGNYIEALQHLEMATTILDQSIIPSPYEKASIFNSTGWIYFLQGKFSEARKSLTTALQLIEGSNHFDLLASIHNRFGAVAYQERSYYESERHVSESLTLRQRMNDKAGVARLYNNLGLLGLMRGNLRMAEENFIQSSSLLERIGDAEGIALSNINIGLVKIDRGDLETAGSYLAKAIWAAEQIGHRYYLALAKLYISRIHTELGDHPAGERVLTESLSVFSELGATDGRVDALYYLAESYLTCQDIEKASVFAKLVEAELNNPNDLNNTREVQSGRLLRLQGKIARHKRDYSLAKAKLEESDRIFSQSSEKLELGRTYLEIGLLAQAQRSASLAKGYFERAILIFDQLGAERDLHRAKIELEKIRI